MTAKKLHRFSTHGVELKQCSTCLQWKTLDQYDKTNKSWDGLRWRCKSCRHDWHANMRKTKGNWRSMRAGSWPHRFGVNDQELKICIDCRVWKPTSDFGRYEEKWDGLNSRCKSCSHGVQRQYRTDPRTRETYLRRNLANTYKRQERVEAAEGSHTDEEWGDLCLAAGCQCMRCGTKEDLCKDHIVPFSKGGNNYIDNIQLLCKPCNSTKGLESWDFRLEVMRA